MPSRTLAKAERPAEQAGSFFLGEWLVEPCLARLTRDHRSVHLRPQLMDLAVVFASRPYQVISKHELFAAVWPRQSVADSALARSVAELRRIFGDDARSPRVIETIPKRGYRLVASVTVPPAADLPARGHVLTPTATAGAGLVEPEREPVHAGPEDGAARGPRPTPDVAVRGGPGRHGGGRDWIRWLAVAALAVGAGLTTFVAGGAGRPLPARPADRVMIADFANRTGEPGLDATLKLALAVQLQREPSIDVLSDAAVRETLGTLQRSEQTPVRGTIAREVCAAQHGAAVVEGSIVAFGARYALGLEAMSCATGTVLGRELAEARSKDEVLAALDIAAASLRRKLAGTLAAARRGRPAQVALSIQNSQPDLGQVRH